MTITTDTFKDKFIAWLQLIRFDKPVGTELLLYPTLWALFLANASIERLPSVVHVIIFTLGAFIMRAAGCAINDFADRRVDAQVKRTKNRPLADGRLTAKTAVLTFVGLSGLSACLLFFACAGVLLVTDSTGSCFYLSIHKTPYTLATGCAGYGVWLGGANGICGGQ